jgi:hypothetical protein
MTHYTLSFSTSTGARRRFRINNVNTALAADRVDAAVDKLLSHDIMHPERGALERLYRMDATTTNVVRVR